MTESPFGNEEQSLIRRAQLGEIEAFESLVRQHEQSAFRAAWLITRDEQEAADAAQDAFLRAYRSLSTLKPGQPFRPWLLRIVTNQSLNRVKAGQRRAKMGERYAQQEMMEQNPTSPERALVERAESGRLLQAVSRLTKDEQLMIGLRYFLELPESEVAASLNIPVGTVKSRIHRTLARLREIIRRDFPDLKFDEARPG